MNSQKKIQLKKRKIKNKKYRTTQVSDAAPELNPVKEATFASDDLFSQLPREIILEILSLLNEKELNAMEKVSQKFERIINESFRLTTYGEALRFATWQNTQLEKFARAIEEFEKPYRVTFFNRPHQTWLGAIKFYIREVGGLSLLPMFIPIGMIYLFEKNMDPLATQNSKILIRFAESLLIFWFLAVSVLLYKTSIQNNSQNTAQYLSFSIVTREHRAQLFEKLELNFGKENAELIEQFKLLFPEGSDFASNNVTDLFQMRTHLRKAIRYAQANQKDLNAYLQSQKSINRSFGPEDFKNIDKIDNKGKNLGKHARALFGFWLEKVAPVEHAEIQKNLRGNRQV